MNQQAAVRPPSLSRFENGVPANGYWVQRARGQNFVVDWMEAAGGGVHRTRSSEESILLLPGPGARVELDAAGQDVPARSVVILPPGAIAITLAEAGCGVLLRSGFDAQDTADCLNADVYREPDPCVAPATAFERQPGTPAIRVLGIDSVAPASGRSRLKMLQSATMSINWVEYQGPRDRTNLSPHSHDDFEQGSLAIHGDYVHHLRVPWGPDATLWRDDLHLQVPPASLTIFPPGLVHTTEGVGDGRHALVDIFCPARADFRAKGWIHNAADYADPP